jgi:hypothetical protein
MEAKLKEIIERHLRYEIIMLFATFEKEVIVPDRYIRAALVESFCIHARNLIDFLRGKSSKGPRVRATSVTYDYKPFANGKIDKALTDKIEDHVAHLGFGRTSDPKEYINRRDRLALLRSIAVELIVFQQHLRPQYRAPWKIKITEHGAPSLKRGVLPHAQQ